MVVLRDERFVELIEKFFPEHVVIWGKKPKRFLLLLKSWTEIKGTCRTQPLSFFTLNYWSLHGSGSPQSIKTTPTTLKHSIIIQIPPIFCLAGVSLGANHLLPLFSCRAEEQERLRQQNEDDLAKLLPKADAFSLRNKYLSKLGAQVSLIKTTLMRGSFRVWLVLRAGSSSSEWNSWLESPNNSKSNEGKGMEGWPSSEAEECL